MPFDIHEWNAIAEYHSGALLLGNGASVAVDQRFRYGSLLQYAREHQIIAGEIEQLFGFFNTADFELVLRLVWQASNVNRSLGIPDERTHEAYLRVRNSLIQAVRDIHPEHYEVAEQIPRIYRFLRQFHTVVSLNYDLILYWVVMHSQDVYDGHSFKDCFLNGRFDDNWPRFRQPINGEAAVTLTFYPHGNLVLCRDAVETEWKVSRGNGELLQSILQLWQGETVVPLFVSEGTYAQKISSIQSSYYLSTVYREVLSSLGNGIVIYGWGFGDQDIHLLQRISLSGVQRVAVSVYGDDQPYCNRAEHILRSTLGQHVQIAFFDSNSPGCWNYVA